MGSGVGVAVGVGVGVTGGSLTEENCPAVAKGPETVLGLLAENKHVETVTGVKPGRFEIAGHETSAAHLRQSKRLTSPLPVRPGIWPSLVVGQHAHVKIFRLYVREIHLITNWRSVMGSCIFFSAEIIGRSEIVCDDNRVGEFHPVQVPHPPRQNRPTGIENGARHRFLGIACEGEHEEPVRMPRLGRD